VTRGLTFQQLMVGLLFGAIGVCACLMPAQPDTYWHLRAGQEIWQTLHVPLRDHYSYTAAGGFWPNHEWLWQALSYGLYRVGGMPALAAGGVAIVMGAYAIAYRLMVGPTATRFVLMLLGMPLATCLWVLRPQIIDLLLLALLLWLLVRERYWVLPLLFVVWANAHGGVAAGGLVLAAVAVVAIVRARRGDARARRRALVLVLLTPICGLATALTPLGFRMWSFIGKSIAMSRQVGNLEWQPTLPVGPFEVGFWILSFSFLGLLIWRRRRLPGASWDDAVLVTAALVILPLGFRAFRNTAAFLLVAMPAASRLLGPDFRFGRPPAAAQTVERPRLNVALLIGISLIELGAVIAAWRAPVPSLGWRPLSDGAIAALRACPAPIYNTFGSGGFLIWFVPEKRVFLDSRQDPYPVSLVQDFIAVQSGGPYRPLFDRYGIRCAFLPASSKTGDRLRGDGWQSRFVDESWAVLVAPGAG
jgi:hypothetical protein